MDTLAMQRKLSDLMTTNDVVRMFNVTPMTVYLWREKRGLPTVVIPGDKKNSVRFVRRDVIKWWREQKYGARRPSIRVRLEERKVS